MNNKIIKTRGSTLTGVISWIASGAIGIVATVALAFASSTSINVNEIKTNNALQDTQIALVKQSACIQNQNMINIARVLEAPVVSDPNCK